MTKDEIGREGKGIYEKKRGSDGECQRKQKSRRGKRISIRGRVGEGTTRMTG